MSESERWPFGPANTVAGDWTDRTGLRCLVIVGPLGALNGYVQVPQGHPWFGLDYDRIEEDVEVHGGLTYAGTGVGAVTGDDQWWLGFDCAHAWDLVPGLRMGENDVLRSPEYVGAECTKLAQQIAAASTRGGS